MANPKDSSTERYAHLFNNRQFSDVTLFLGPSQTPVLAHRMILGVRSPFFATALTGDFKESAEQTFRFKQYSAHALWRVFHYMYTNDYTEEAVDALGAEGDDLELLKHPRVFAIADMFQMDDLKTLARERFEKQLKQHWISDTFTDCIREVYETTQQTETAMRRMTVEMARIHIKELYPQKCFQALVREVGDFAVDMVGQITTGGKDY